MSLEMTFRQKLIRISCSAAICGLSLSFLAGEAVDREAKLLREWKIDPRLIPEFYSPLAPLAGALEKFESDSWKSNLVAINSFPVLPTPSTPQLTPPEAPTLADAVPDRVRVASAAPIKEVLKKPSIDSREPIRPKLSPVPSEPELKPADVEKILVSIHDAAAKLSAPVVASKGGDLPPSVNRTQNPKVDPKPEKLEESPVVSDVPAPKHPKLRSPQMVTASASSPAPTPASPWVIQGKIYSVAGRNLEPGHFEIGLFAKIDPEEKPVGYPLPQQILPAGQTTFRLDVPAKVERGYLFAEFVAAGSGKRTLIAPPSNPWVKGTQRVAELFYKPEDVISSVSAASSHEPNRDRWTVQGTVTTMFVPGSANLPQPDVVVKVRGRKESARTDRQGNFSLDLHKAGGTVFLELLKAGYHPTIVSVNTNETRPLRLEIASRHAIDQISQRLGASQGSLRGVFVGRALSADGNPLKGMTAQMSLKADGPFYFDDNGVATSELRATGASGRFLFLNVEAGTGYLETSVNGETVAPVQISSVEGGELISKTLTPVSGTLKGRIFNPIAGGGKLSPIAGAKVRFDGTGDWVNSDSYGAFSIGPTKWMKGEKISLELSAERFNNHRYLVNPDQPNGLLNLFAFPAAYVQRLAHSMDVDIDPYAGLIIGKVSGPSLRIDALADHSTVNNARDFYFDFRGRLRGSHEMTDPRFGNYIIFNVPKGRAILQGNDASGTLRYSDAVLVSPSSINVQMD